MKNQFNIRKAINEILNTRYNWSLWLITFLIWMLFTENIANSHCLKNYISEGQSEASRAGFIFGVYLWHFVLIPLTIFFLLIIVKRVLRVKSKSNNVTSHAGK